MTLNKLKLQQLGFPRFYALALVTMGMASPCAAGAIITVPPGLAAGSQYRLAFDTPDAYQTLVTDISYYNAIVNSLADSVPTLDELGTTWSVIGSTSSVNAITNIGIDAGVNIYNLAGDLVADDASTNLGGLFSGYPLFSAIDIEEDGTVFFDNPVWTGTDGSGMGIPMYTLGPSSGYSTYGVAGLVASGDWIDYDQRQSSTGTPSALYAISGVLTVPSATPEPATTVMFIMGGAIILGMRRMIKLGARTLC